MTTPISTRPSGGHEQRLRLPGAKMLGLLARDRAGRRVRVFLTRLVEATRSLKVGPAEDPATSVGPVIDAEAFAHIKEYIDIGRGEEPEVAGGGRRRAGRQGLLHRPPHFCRGRAEAAIAQEEIFGPVLAVIRAGDLDEAIAIANGTDYALTGGIYSRSPRAPRRAAPRNAGRAICISIEAITGALVERQPFGGFKMSGIGTRPEGMNTCCNSSFRQRHRKHDRRGFAPPADAASGSGE